MLSNSCEGNANSSINNAVRPRLAPNALADVLTFVGSGNEPGSDARTVGEARRAVGDGTGSRDETSLANVISSAWSSVPSPGVTDTSTTKSPRSTTTPPTTIDDCRLLKRNALSPTPLMVSMTGLGPLCCAAVFIASKWLRAAGPR